MSKFIIEQIELYNNLIKTNPDIEKKGKTTPYTSINGHMFSFLSKDGSMGLRLSESDRESFISEYYGKLMVQHGRTMKEFVEIPDELFSDTEKLTSYLQKSLDYVSSLKPKPTKKKK